MSDEIWVVITSDKWGSFTEPALLDDVQASIDTLDKLHTQWTGEVRKTRLVISGIWVKDSITGETVGEVFEYPY